MWDLYERDLTVFNLLGKGGLLGYQPLANDLGMVGSGSLFCLDVDVVLKGLGVILGQVG